MKPRKKRMKLGICFELFSCFSWASRYSMWKGRVILDWTSFIYGWINRQFDVFKWIDIFVQTVAACNMVCNLSLLMSNERIRHILFCFFPDRTKMELKICCRHLIGSIAFKYQFPFNNRKPQISSMLDIIIL